MLKNNPLMTHFILKRAIGALFKLFKCNNNIRYSMDDTIGFLALTLPLAGILA